MKTKRIEMTSVCLAAAMLIGGSAFASTEAQKQAAIDSGLAWLATQQGGSGQWNNSLSGGYNAADTSSALLAFIEQKGKPLGWHGVDYTTQVTDGLNYLMSQATAVGVGLRPDGNNAAQGGTNQGIYWGAQGETTYISGLALTTLAKAVSTGYVSAATVITSTNAAVNGKTYGQVIQESVNMYLAGQSTGAGNYYRGGWHYYPSQGDADNSTSQWAAISMLAAQGAGAVVPQYTKDELKYWIDRIQNSANGGSGYQDPNQLVNESKTGGLLVEMAFTGYDGSGGTPIDTGGMSNKAGAVSFLNTNWKDGPGATWDGNFGHPYSMWSVYKGLESTIGLTGGAINNFMFTGAAAVKDDPSDVWNWWEDYSQYLTNSQALNGSWAGYDYWGQNLATAWYINILNATSIGPGPTVPEPASLGLVGIALLALVGLRRRA